MPRAKILLVDDTKLVLELEKSYLKLSDVEVLTACNGAEALETVRKDPPDLIFMDMHMPVMDGISCCSTLKADPFLSGIPVVMLTTAGREGDRERAAAAGCDAFLTKPIDRREFLEMARRYTQDVDRRELRLLCHIPVLYLLGNLPAVAHAMDISDGGVFLASRNRVRQNDSLKLALYLPLPEPALIAVTGRVAWVNEDGKRLNLKLPAGFGVEFQELKEYEVAALQAFLGGENPARPGQGEDL